MVHASQRLSASDAPRTAHPFRSPFRERIVSTRFLSASDASKGSPKDSADGTRPQGRSADDGTPVAVNGIPATLAGRPSMDMLTVDVTGLPGVAIGDRVELWGREVPVERVADSAGTIPYELTCRVGRRVSFSTT